MRYVYPACFYPEENDQYSVIFPDLGDISTYGNNLEDAMNMAADLLCMWILDSKRNNEDLPKPSDVKNMQLDAENGFVNLIMADLDFYILKNNKSVKKTLTIPAWLNELAEKEGVNFSKELQKALREKLHVEA